MKKSNSGGIPTYGFRPNFFLFGLAWAHAEHALLLKFTLEFGRRGSLQL